jgi:hypothetical protein
MTSPTSEFIDALAGKNTIKNNYPSYVGDPQGVYWNESEHDLQVEVDFFNLKPDVAPKSLAKLNKVVITTSRVNHQVSLQLFCENKPLDTAAKQMSINAHNQLHIDGQSVADLSTLFSVFSILTKTLYIPSFRNLTNTGSRNDYYDIQVGQGFIFAWRNYKTGSLKANNRAALRLTEDIRRIFCFDKL